MIESGAGAFVPAPDPIRRLGKSLLHCGRAVLLRRPNHFFGLLCSLDASA